MVIFETNYVKVFILILIFVLILSFSIGRYPIPIHIVLKVFISKFINSTPTWPEIMGTIIFKIRFPRIIAAVVVGGCLSLSGAVYQGIFKNPMASPDLLGVSSGAAFGASLAILLSYSDFKIQILSFIFGLIAVGLVYLLVSRIKESGLTSLIIVGILVGAVFSSLTSLIKYLADTNNKLPTITFWLMGSLSDISLKDIKMIIVPIFIGIIPLLILRWRLNILSLNDDEAKTLGVDTKRIRAIVIMCSTLITASSVSISGMIGWIGLVIPHLCRMMVGPDYKILLPSSILLGGIYLLVIDTIARTITTIEIPIGILTSLIGAPVFILLLIIDKRRKR